MQCRYSSDGVLCVVMCLGWLLVGILMCSVLFFSVGVKVWFGLWYVVYDVFCGLDRCELKNICLLSVMRFGFGLNVVDFVGGGMVFSLGVMLIDLVVVVFEKSVVVIYSVVFRCFKV